MTTDLLDDIVVHPARRLTGRLTAALAVSGADSFETEPVAGLDLTLEGVPGDLHAGFTRAAGSREPWHPRGVEIRSGRQLSIVSEEELAEVAARLGLPRIEAGWIGANLLLSGVARLSFLPAGARLFFDSGAVVVVEEPNAPCRDAGRAIAGHTGRPGDELSFPKAARRLRGVVASVERAGRVASGEAVAIRVPEQWIY
ncbi:MOSC domain-containing protein [Methylopila musalis]|uniref:MOSC domain-containing protein n=1 Tax=Methylopila musalis TaxID=1134781 RepID=A0ABW3Z9E8_9HYPH